VWHKDRLAEKPPVVRDVQRKAFAATLSAPIPLLHEDFYKKDPLLLDDLLRKYCACAVALLSASAGTGMFSQFRAHQRTGSGQQIDIRRTGVPTPRDPGPGKVG
jgi:hypothetical protein